MNKTIAESKVFGVESIELQKFAKSKNVEIGIAPTYLSLQALKEANPKLNVASQNLHFEDHGAFTGEIAIPMLLELGVTWAIIGHSERRTYYAESNESCNKKLLAMEANKMTPIYCVGETLEQFEKGVTKKVIEEQTLVGLKGLSKAFVEEMVIAYEPVWSIGTGKNASKEIAQDICSFIRELVRKEYGDAADKVRSRQSGLKRGFAPKRGLEILRIEISFAAVIDRAAVRTDYGRPVKIIQIHSADYPCNLIR